MPDSSRINSPGNFFKDLFLISDNSGFFVKCGGYNKDYLSGFFNIELMLKKFKGCLLGAAIGDALGMPNESAAPNLNKMKYGYRRP